MSLRTLLVPLPQFSPFTSLPFMLTSCVALTPLPPECTHVHMQAHALIQFSLGSLADW